MFLGNDERVQKAVKEHLRAQSNYQKQLALKKRDEDLKKRLDYLKTKPDELMRALHVKKLEIDRLVERKAMLTEKIMAQYVKNQMMNDDKTRGDLHSHRQTSDYDGEIIESSILPIPEMSSSSRF